MAAVTLEIIIDDQTVGGETVALITAKADAVLIPDYTRRMPTSCSVTHIQYIVEIDLFGEYIWTSAPTITDNRV